MKSTHVIKSIVLASVCACALVIAVGCTSSGSSGSGSASASGSANASAASASASATSASTSAASASTSAASASAQSASTSTTSAAASAPAASASTQNASASASAPAASTSAPAASASAASTTASATSSGAAQSDELTPEKAIEQGYQVFEGTVHVFTAEELVDFQDLEVNPEMISEGGDYAIIAFDGETIVSGMGADGSGERSDHCFVMGIAEYTEHPSYVHEYGDLESWLPYDGQHVTLAVKAQDIMFPSDVRLPLGEPWTPAAIVL